jgi:hypothetical protein
MFCSSVYLDVGNQVGDQAVLDFAFMGMSTTRLWEIKVTQIVCGSIPE